MAVGVEVGVTVIRTEKQRNGNTGRGGHHRTILTCRCENPACRKVFEAKRSRGDAGTHYCSPHCVGVMNTAGVVHITKDMLIRANVTTRTDRDLAWQFGVTPQRIQQLRSKYGIPRVVRMMSALKYARRSRWPREGIQKFKRTHGYCVWNSCTREAIEGRTMCAEHLETNAEKTRRFNAQRRSLGLCIRCQQPVSPSNHWYCEEHRRAMADWQIKHYHERKAVAV